jgi:hypothetical protein
MTVSGARDRLEITSLLPARELRRMIDKRGTIRYITDFDKVIHIPPSEAAFAGNRDFHG